MKTKVNLSGPKGRISALLQRPELPDGQKCPLVILMHGFMANKALQPLKSIAQALEAEGIASLRFDFDGHGRSDGKFCEMTVLTEIEDAKVVFTYAKTLDFVSKIAFLGHSQGGVVAGMLAGELGAGEVTALVQLAPAAVLKDDALNGVLMGKTYDPANPPEKLRVFFHSVGKCYFQVAQKLPIYETSAKYDGPVCLIHGTEDSIVPHRYSEQYDAVYKNSVLHILEGENHILSKRRPEVMSLSVEFLKDKLK
ncbi:MAG: alpha/beta fold hydrolase [Bacteroidales bacterium]|nr:alpha/beta fold hydrolase [Bacteroidales bacterium]